MIKGYVENYIHAKHKRQTNANVAQRLRDSAQSIDDEELLLKMAECLDNLQHYVEDLSVRVMALEDGPRVPRND